MRDTSESESLYRALVAVSESDCKLRVTYMGVSDIAREREGYVENRIPVTCYTNTECL